MKIVVGDPTKGIAPKGSKPGHAKLRTSRGRTESGELVTMYAVDAHSDTLTNDMLTVFRRSVARARRKARQSAKKLGIAAE